jgi:hypothetical protein
MSRAPAARRRRVAVAAASALAALVASVGSPGLATGFSIHSCGEVPIEGGIPPWGFHTGAFGAPGAFARGHGDINLSADTVSGILCQMDAVPGESDPEIVMTVEHHLVYHSHDAVMWGYPGNEIKIIVTVQSSTDPKCAVGTKGHATLFASYNGVRSDSVEFTFPAACKTEDHLYHGSQVNNQVPPL